MAVGFAGPFEEVILRALGFLFHRIEPRHFSRRSSKTDYHRMAVPGGTGRADPLLWPFGDGHSFVSGSTLKSCMGKLSSLSPPQKIPRASSCPVGTSLNLSPFVASQF